MQIPKPCYPRRHTELLWYVHLTIVRVSNTSCWNNHSKTHRRVTGCRCLSGRFHPLYPQASCTSWLRIPWTQCSPLRPLPLARREQGADTEKANVVYNSSAQRGTHWWEMPTPPPPYLWEAGVPGWITGLKRRRQDSFNTGQHGLHSPTARPVGWLPPQVSTHTYGPQLNVF